MRLLDRDERRIMQHALLPARISVYVERITPAIARDLASWPADGMFEAAPALQSMIFDITSEVLTGSGLGTAPDEVHRMFEACLRASNSPLRVSVPGLPWSRGIAARRRLEEIFGAWVAERRASDGPVDNLLSMLCAAATEDGERLRGAVEPPGRTQSGGWTADPVAR